MLFRRKIFRLGVGLGVGLTFFGCVGLPTRKPTLEPQPPTATRPQPRKPAPTPAFPPRQESHQPQRLQSGEERSQQAPSTPSRLVARGQDSSDSTVAELRRVYAAAAKAYSSMDSYIARLTRREWVKGAYQPEEVIVFRFRKEPWSVHLKWVGKEGRGREAIYVKGQHENKLHAILAAGDAPFTSAGQRLAVTLDSPLLCSRSRHCITQVGIGVMLEHLAQLVQQAEKGDRSRRPAFLARQKREEFSALVDCVTWLVPAGAEKHLPRGGQRWCYFDPESRLPVLVVTRDEQNQEVEYYRYDRLQSPAQLDDDDFNPARLWKHTREPDQRSNR